MEFEIWHYWLIAAFAFFVLEVFVPGFILGSLGIGCLLASIGAIIGLPFWANIFLVLIGFIVSMVLLKPLLRRFGTTNTIKTNADGLIGKIGKVIEPIDITQGTGRVHVDGDDWKAVSSDHSKIEIGEAVEIIALDSIIVTVKLLNQKKDQPDPEPSKNSESVSETLKNNTGLIVSIGTRKEVIRHEEILSFYSAQKISYLVSTNGKQVVVDDSLERLEEQLDGRNFFRVNRQFIISPSAVKNFHSHENGKTQVNLVENTHLPGSILVSRLKSHAFRKWLNKAV